MCTWIADYYNEAAEGHANVYPGPSLIISAYTSAKPFRSARFCLRRGEGGGDGYLLERTLVGGIFPWEERERRSVIDGSVSLFRFFFFRG